MQVSRKTVRRKVVRDINAAKAAEAVGNIEPGCEIYGLSKGQFSLVELIGHCLEATGPADIIVSTWTAAGADLEHTHGLLENGNIRSARWLVDSSFINRQPGYTQRLLDLFGEEAVLATKNHAKFVLIENETWSLVIRTSMNLNLNSRLESYEVSDCRPMADMLKTLYEGIKAEGLTAKRAQTARKDCDSGLTNVLGQIKAKDLNIEYDATKGIGHEKTAKNVSYD